MEKSLSFTQNKSICKSNITSTFYLCDALIISFSTKMSASTLSALSIDYSISSSDDDNNSNNNSNSNSNNNNGRTSTRNLTVNQRKAVLELYDQFDCKTSALQVINSIIGFQDINESKIKRWKKQVTMNSPGRPISDEFEMEVMKECERVSRLFEVKRVATSNLYTYSVVKHCANEVLHKDFWDDETSSFVKKWQYDKRTCNLRFTNKWILGVLQRESKRRVGEDHGSSNAAMEDPSRSSSYHFSTNDDSQQQQDPSVDALGCCDDDSLTSFFEDFIAFDAADAAAHDDQELEWDHLLVDLESLDRDQKHSVSSYSSSSTSSTYKGGAAAAAYHCLGDDLLDFDFDCVF